MNRIDFLWRTILRFDNYISTTNAKSAFLIAWNTFVFGTLVFKGVDFAALFAVWSWGVPVLGALIALLAIATLVSLWFTFWVVIPYTKSPKIPMDYHSTVFFGHVEQFDSPERYRTQVNFLDEDAAVRDLCMQAHTLARGLAAKFTDLERAIGAVIYAQLPLILLLVIAFAIRKAFWP